MRYVICGQMFCPEKNRMACHERVHNVNESNGDPYGNRTRVARMKTWSPNR